MLSCAALLVVSAIPKIRRPSPTIIALRAVGLTWVGPWAVRALSLTEILVGATAIVHGGRLADAGVAGLYLGFSVFLVRALRTPAASCGCTGRDDTPPTLTHLVLTTLFATGAIAAVVAGGATGLATIAQDADGARVVVALGFALTATWLGWSILTLSLKLPAAAPQAAGSAHANNRKW
jgi:hypothetical protein